MFVSGLTLCGFLLPSRSEAIRLVVYNILAKLRAWLEHGGETIN
jgi:hypothetical protein